eukprot:CAMPEP_0197426030 /NCGR_PEP_ID=MMETSP1170-20131217/33443_1 /TAXON_ID=54406 /ORGANISM="Sarcinochrysis sp, Strain CCMP770" /LENGTH=73 /DNA_ID=CAMNT_0042953641 /DNA_START=51 /DNA_END=269 /DNA_ORIENTATION=-
MPQAQANSTTSKQSSRTTAIRRGCAMRSVRAKKVAFCASLGFAATIVADYRTVRDIRPHCGDVQQIQASRKSR